MSNYEIELQVQGSPSGELTQQVDGEPGGGSVSAREAEAWARGTRAGTAVSSDDPTYHNNSKYYAEQAHDAAESASAAYGTNLLAPTFDASQAYPAGAHVIHDGGYYVLPEGHTAGDTWAETSKTQLTVGGEVTGLKSAILLQEETIPDTTQTISFDSSGNVSSIVHKDGSNNTIRSDAFTFGTNTITEVRTLYTGETLTIVTNTETLETVVTYAAA